MYFSFYYAFAPHFVQNFLPLTRAAPHFLQNLGPDFAADANSSVSLATSRFTLSLSSPIKSEVIGNDRLNIKFGDVDIEKDKAGDKDVGKAIDIISKFSVWPCLNFRICGKIL